MMTYSLIFSPIKKKKWEKYGGDKSRDLPIRNTIGIYIYIKSGNLKQRKDWSTENQIVGAKHIKL